MAPQNFNICKIVSLYGRIITEVPSMFNDYFQFLISKDSFHTENSWGRCQLTPLVWLRTFPDKNRDWQGWDSLTDMNRFILKGLQGHVQSEVKIIFQFFIYIWFLFTLNFTITSTIHNYDKNLEEKRTCFPGQFFTIICLKSSLKFSQVSQKTGLNDPHWVSHAAHMLNISLSFILS